MTATSEGTITRQLKWISTYPKPDKVLVDVSGYAWYAYSGGYSVPPTELAENFQKDPMEPDEYAGYDWAQKSVGAEYVWLDVDPTTGIAEYSSFQKAETGSRGGYGTQVRSDADTYSVTFAEKAVGIKPFAWPTYFKHPTTAVRTKNPTEFLTQREMDTVAVYHDPPGGGVNPHWDITGATFTKESWGSWPDPFHEWWANNDSWADGLFTEYTSISTDYNWDWSVFSAATGHETETIDLHVTDQGSTGFTWLANLKMRVHAPAENVSSPISIRKHAAWTPISPNAWILAGTTTGFASMTMSYSVGVEAKLTLGSSYSMSAGILGIAEAAIGSTRAALLGLTAGITTSVGLNLPWRNLSYDTWQWLQIRAFWYEDTYAFDEYAVDGYVGPGTFTHQRWRSTTQALAAAVDYDLEIGFDELP